MNLSGIAIYVPADTLACDWIDDRAVITQERDGFIEVECERHDGKHTGSVELAEILPYL